MIAEVIVDVLNSEVDKVIKMILDNICQNEIIRKYKERQL